MSSNGNRKRLHVFFDSNDSIDDPPRGPTTKESVLRYLDLSNRARHAHALLAERKLIELTMDGDDGFIVSLTVDGYDIGVEYSSFFGRIQYFWKRVKDNWSVAIIMGSGGIFIGAAARELVSQYMR